MKKSAPKHTQWFSWKPLILFVFLFIGIGTVAQVTYDNCTWNGNRICDKADIDSENIVYICEDGRVTSGGTAGDCQGTLKQYRVTNHTGELVDGYTPGASAHNTVLSGGFTGGVPTAGYHQMDQGTYSGKWIGINMKASNGTDPDYNVYESKPRRIFIPHRNKEAFFRFYNTTRRQGEKERNLNTGAVDGTAVNSTDGNRLAHIEGTKPGIEICELEPVTGYTECKFVNCGDTFTDFRPMPDGTYKSYDTVQIGDKCVFADDLEYSELTQAQAEIFRDQPNVIYSYDEVFSEGAWDPSVPPAFFSSACEALLPGFSAKDGKTIRTGATYYGKHFSVECTAYDHDPASSDPDFPDEINPVEAQREFIYGGLKEEYASYSPGPEYTTNMVKSASSVGGDDGLCPAGWHVPTDTEWREIETDIGLAANLVDKWPHDGMTGAPEDGVISDNSSPTYYDRDMAVNPLLTALGWGTPGFLERYFMRDRTTEKEMVYHTTKDVHITRYIQVFEGAWEGTIRFNRILFDGSVGGSSLTPIDITQNLLPRPLNWILSFVVPLAEALPADVQTGRVRCVQGEEGAKSWTQSTQWECTSERKCPQGCGSYSYQSDSCSNTDSNCIPFTHYSQTRDDSCFIGTYQVHPGHCVNSSLDTTGFRPTTTPNTDQSIGCPN